MKHQQEDLLPVNSSIFIMFMSPRALSPPNTSSKQVNISKDQRYRGIQIGGQAIYI